MKARILAAGYATRLYPLTQNRPKPLLEVGGKAIIDYIIEKIDAISEVDTIYVVTNNRFYSSFKEWSFHKEKSIPIKIINDGTSTNEDRLGAVGDIHFVLNQEEIEDDLVVIAGDNLFGFSLSGFVHFFHEQDAGSVVAFRDLKDREKVRGKYGVGILEGSKVVGFEEKPLQPQSTLASTACYLFNKQDLPLVEQSIKQGKADNPGDLVRFLTTYSTVHGFVFTEHWFDIGSFESLEEAQSVYAKGVEQK